MHDSHESLTCIVRLAHGHEGALRILEHVAWDMPHEASAIFAFLGAHGVRGSRLARLYSFAMTPTSRTFNRDMARKAAALTDTLRCNHDIRLPPRTGAPAVRVLDYLCERE